MGDAMVAWVDWMVKALLGLLGAVLAWLWKDTRSQIAEMRGRVEAQDKTLAVLQSTVEGRQALMLEKIEGIEKKFEGVSRTLTTMNETLIQLRIEKRKDG